MDRLGRREFVRAAVLGSAGLSGCGALGLSDSQVTDATTVVADEPGTETASAPVEGAVVTPDGEPIADATVSAVVGRGEPIAEAATGTDGEFSLDVGRPAWLSVAAEGYVERTVAAEPGVRRRIELVEREGTVSMSFGGDVMFGRRFYEADDDPLAQRFRIRPGRRRADHEAILEHVRPLLRTADLASVNLETPLTTAEWRHPEKAYTFVSHPVAADALERAGLDYAALGNNHVFDALGPGLEETVERLDAAGIAHSGAGSSSDRAWEPAYVDRGGLTVGLVSCTTVTGEQYDLDWAAGGSGTHTVRSGGETLRVQGSAGAAAAAEDRLAAAVRETAGNADVTVVQIHGGSEYRRTPTPTVERLTEAATAAGADVVANHHPHVTGGLAERDSALVAWSLGNLVFDQEIWATFPSYVLTVHATADGVRRASLDPVLLEGYVPKGVVGEPRSAHLWRTAGLSGDRFALDRATLRYGTDPDVRTERRSLTGDDAIYARGSGWVEAVTDGESAVALGRDLLPTGEFEDHDVDDRRYEGPLWRFGRRERATGPGTGREGGGLRLIREPDNTERAILEPVKRIPIPGTGPLTLTGLYRYGADEGLEVRVSWYVSTSGGSLDSAAFDLGATGGEWTRLRRDLRPPDAAEYADFVVRHSPPESGGERVAALDDLRLIAWNDGGDGDEGGREHDHLRVRGSATVRFATAAGEIEWPRL